MPRRILILLALLFLLVPAQPVAAQQARPTAARSRTPTRTPRPSATPQSTLAPESATSEPTATPTAQGTVVPKLAITSPRAGAVIGGIVSILGSVEMEGLRGYTLAFGAGDSPTRWIQIGEVYERSVLDGRLTFWDTTQIPDGLYTLRLRAIIGGETLEYRDFFVNQILVSNAPRSPTPAPTQPPTATPTLTPTPSATPTEAPTPALDDGVSPYLYVTQMDQYDPLCTDWSQRYSIWVSNVGMITVTNIVLTDTLPFGCQPVLEDSTEGATYDGEQTVVWQVGSLLPGEAKKFELQVTSPSWLEVGQWVTNKVTLSSEQVPFVAKSEQSLISKCTALKQTAAAKPFALPTGKPSPTLTRALSKTAGQAASQATDAPKQTTPLPTTTPLAFSLSEQAVNTSLDLLTVLIAAALVVLLIVTIVLVYRRVFKKF